MVCEIAGVAMVNVEVLYEAVVARPEKYFVVAVTEMVCEAGSKVACSKDKNSGFGWGRRRQIGRAHV